MGEGVTHELPKYERHKVYAGRVFNVYPAPGLASFLDCVHAKLLPNALLWECEGDVVISDGTSAGCIKLTTIRTMPVPALTTEQRVGMAIRCAMHCALRGSKREIWAAWAEAWLTGADRSEASARTAAEAVSEAIDWSADASVRAAYAATEAAGWGARTAGVETAAHAAALAAATAADWAAHATGNNTLIARVTAEVISE